MKLLRTCAWLGMLLVSTEALAQSDDTSSVPTAKFAVVTGKGRGAPNLKRPVAKYVEKKLKIFGEQVSFKQFKKTARKSGIKRPKDLATVATARTVGAELGLTHVVIVNSVREREKVGKRKKNVFYGEVSVVEMSSGDVTYTNRFALAGRRLNLAIGVEMVEAIGSVMKPPAEPEPEPIAEDDPVAMAPPPPPPPTEGEPTGEPADDAPPPPEPPGDPIAPPEQEPEVFAEASPEPEPAATGSTFEILGGDTDASVESEYEPRRRRKTGRPGFTFLVGPSFYDRSSSVSGANTTEDINYDGPVVGAGVELGLFPFAFDGKGDFVEGLGLYARGNYSRVTTEFDPSDTSRTVDRDVYGGEGGLAIRFPFGNTLEDPEIMVVLGYAYWQFPLSDGFFPGAKYMGPYAQLNLTIPFVEEFAFVLDGGIIPLLDTDGRTKRLGELDSGLAFNGNAGFKFLFAPFDIRLLGHYRQYDASYTGASTLGLPGEELQNAELSDTYIGGSVLLGVSL
ncbi:MAG: hypothetical protein AAF658_13905 [Myxococcota bacterium]